MSVNFWSISKFSLFLICSCNLIGCNPLGNTSQANQNSTKAGFVEKAEILDISASVIWGGEETLGGNWISHPKVQKPERVLIRNMSNGKSVVGAVLQQTLNTESSIISSDAAKTLGINKNEQTKVQIIAVRAANSTAEKKENTSLDFIKSSPNKTDLAKPFIQVGIFGVKNNADKTKNKMVDLDLPVTVFTFEIKGKQYWRVVAGPANSSDVRSKMLQTIQTAGFRDAYFVSN